MRTDCRGQSGLMGKGDVSMAYATWMEALGRNGGENEGGSSEATN